MDQPSTRSQGTQPPTTPEGAATRRVATFQQWTGSRSITCIGTNAGAQEIPFQGWRRFKEAFAPELVQRAVRDSEIRVRHCLDPFGGSGTTALACQFLGIKPITIEVNPYLADLIEAKLATYNTQSLKSSLAYILGRIPKIDPSPDLRAIKRNAPPTFVQPGVENRFVFFADVLHRILAFRNAIDTLHDPSIKQLFRVLLGATCIPVSNVTVSGKGRRYRANWRRRRPIPLEVDQIFASLAKKAFGDIDKYGHRPQSAYQLFRNDARSVIHRVSKVDLAVMSPPYPNSSDYTDVYNVELWVMGYLMSPVDNVKLRQSTLSSHVQLKRPYAPAPKGSRLLDDAIGRLDEKQTSLWHPDIPSMIGAYFADILTVLRGIHSRLARNGRVYIVLGDSRYAEVTICSASILSELAKATGYGILSSEPFRSMRVAPQQGGDPRLAETLLVLRHE
jgi:hypothetical protein